MQPEYPNYSYVNQPQNKSPLAEIVSKRNIIIALITLAILALGWFTWDQFFHKKTVTFQASSGMLIQIGTSTKGENGIQIQHVLGQSSTQKSVKINPGSYVIVFSGSGFVEQIKTVTLDSNLILTSPKLAYSQDKLTGLLAGEKTSIYAALGKSVDLKTYTPANERLFTDASWYAAQLIPTDQTNQDRLNVVLHKENDTWKVVAGPKIVLALADYPSVPEIVIRTINNLPYGQQQ